MKLWPFCGERRAVARQESAVAAEFVVRDGFSGKQFSLPCPAQVLDLSPKGCRLALSHLDCGGFHLHRCLEAPKDYIVELRLAGENGHSRQIQAEVRWLNRDMQDRGLPFRVGLCFPEQDRHASVFWRHIQGG
ncbi:MAG: PilZ domain-containing protein [Proteobacteria bacterium]|nr:PilZ domain-containing protein [Pseudomonadota bacterium]MBU1452039.1 PilZ domain-containing protein [Pseudomonadota bacterium]MBU2467746.1 PilZ domain-containing protein [Pseudomonadota bacterium]MBU2517502.1 PilZ domain-containing protein [Pseudomonadota bacterium]